jgi:hypothetical protein
MSQRAQRKDELVGLMGVETAEDDTRYITLHGVAVGRMTRLEDGQWRCEWRSTKGWWATPSTLEQDHSERAEQWATEEVADAFAMEEEDRGKPLGPSGACRHTQIVSKAKRLREERAQRESREREEARYDPRLTGTLAQHVPGAPLSRVPYVLVAVSPLRSPDGREMFALRPVSLVQR